MRRSQWRGRLLFFRRRVALKRSTSADRDEKAMIPSDQDYAARVRSSFDRQQAMALLGAQMTEVQAGMTEITLLFREALVTFIQSSVRPRTSVLGIPASRCRDGTLVLYRRAYGNSRLWSGSDNPAANERVRRSQRVFPVGFAGFGPGIPRL